MKTIKLLPSRATIEAKLLLCNGGEVHSYETMQEFTRLCRESNVTEGFLFVRDGIAQDWELENFLCAIEHNFEVRPTRVEGGETK